MSIKLDKKPEDSRLAIFVSGNIDEDANFQPIEVGGQSGVVLDLSGVTGINSVGIREWIKWIKPIASATKLSVRKCPKSIVDQINMVAGFLPGGTQIESFYVPYYSDASGTEKNVLFEKGKHFDGGDIKAPEEVKDESGQVMEMDVIEAKYFKFLKNG